MKKRNKKKHRGGRLSKKHIAFAVVALFFLLAGTFYFSPVKGIVAQKLLAKGNHYFNGGAYDLNKAEKYYKIASWLDLKSSTAHYQLARIYFVKNSLSEARKEIDKALAINPSNKRAYYIRGLIDGYAKNYKAAEDDFQKFIEWSPKEWAGYNDLAWAYYEDGDYQNAKEAALAGLAVIPENSWLLNGLGTAYLGLGEKDKAEEAFSKAEELSGELTASQWARAYPGNNPDDAPWDLAQFKTEVKTNLSTAGEGGNSAKKAGVFKPACCSASGVCNYFCSGSSCVPDDGTHPPLTGFPGGGLCDPYHLGIYDWTSYCAGFGAYSPANCHACYLAYGFGDLKSCTTDAECAPPLYCGDVTCNNGETYSSCPSDCVNHTPTVLIASPSSGSTQNPAGTIFSINVQDQDNDTLTVTASTLSCIGPVNPLISRTATNTSTVQNISGTYASLPAGASCIWNVTVFDGSLQASANVSFQTQAAASACSVSCSPGSIAVLPGGSASFTPSCSGSSCSPFTVNSCSRTSDASGNKIHVNPIPSGNTCLITTDSDVSFSAKATANAATSCVPCTADVNITIRRPGWIETNP